ncbi:hypothetical protein ABW20_dc0107477 [Dactylellina cionopaga]|nr:hypothetical protein ABW20_dc0107477 [Dactylellina cionopaga]
MSEDELTAEQRRMLQQQLADLGDHRVTALPLGDRQPGRHRGPPPPRMGRMEGPGDARVLLGPRPGRPSGATDHNPLKQPRERMKPLDPRWADLQDNAGVMERKDGLGEGDLHRGGAWKNSGLVIDQNAFFNTMAKNTGLKLKPPGPSNTQFQPNAHSQKPVAKPMASAKDLNLDITKIETSQPSGPRVSSGFIPPHLRLTQKGRDEELAKDAVEPVETKPAAVVPEIQQPAPAIAPTPSKARTPSPSPQVRSPTPPTSPVILEQEQAQDDLETVRAPSLKIVAANATGEFTSQFWELVAKPLLGDLIWDYKDVHQQTIFLSSYYSSHPDQWQHVLENGPPTPEFIANISRDTLQEIRRQENERRVQTQELIQSVRARSQDKQSEQSITWWNIATPEYELEEWAKAVGYSHTSNLLAFLKDEVRDEKDPQRSKLLYQQIREILHHRKAISGDSGSPKSTETLEERLKEVSLSDQAARSTSIGTQTSDENIRGDENAPGGDKVQDEKKLSPLSKFMAEFDDVMEHLKIPLSSGIEKAEDKTEDTPFVEISILNQRENRFNRSFVEKTTVKSSSIAPSYRDASDERREREKQDRIAQINKTFEDEKKAKLAGSANTRGTDGHQETPTEITQDSRGDLLDFEFDGVSINPEAKVESMYLNGIIGTCKAGLEMSKGSEKSITGEETPILDQFPEDSFEEELNMDALCSAADITINKPQIGARELQIIRAQNRDRLPELAARDPWRFHTRLYPCSPEEEPIIIYLDCADKMPYDFVMGIRRILGPANWPEVSAHPNFRKVVIETTNAFYGKMAKKWGDEFAYGIAD